MWLAYITFFVWGFVRRILPYSVSCLKIHEYCICQKKKKYLKQSPSVSSLAWKTRVISEKIAVTQDVKKTEQTFGWTFAAWASFGEFNFPVVQITPEVAMGKIKMAIVRTCSNELSFTFGKAVYADTGVSWDRCRCLHRNGLPSYRSLHHYCLPCLIQTSHKSA